MNPDAAFETLCLANPVAPPPPTVAVDRADLFEAIVAAPGDPRLASQPQPAPQLQPAPPRGHGALPLPRPRAARPLPGPRAIRPRARFRRRRLALTLAVVLALSVGTAWATSGSSPLAIFTANPQESGRADGPWHQSVIPATVHPVASVTIPGGGEATFWYARTLQGGWCSAIRLPGGGWAGTGEEPESVDAGGTVPGCQPTRSQINAAGGGPPVYEIDGFDYDEALVGDRAAGGLWRILYGEVTGETAPTKVVDQVSGRTAPVEDGHLFVLTIPDPEPMELAPVHLVGTDASGAVVADTAAPQG